MTTALPRSIALPPRSARGASEDPVLIHDLPELRAKIQGFEGRWLYRWERFQQCALVTSKGNHEALFPLHAAFAYVVTSKRDWAVLAAANLRWLLVNYEPRLIRSGIADSDTWMHAAPMTRRAIALDWIWNSGALPQTIREQLADLFITDSLKYPYTVLHHRIPAHANNQGLAQALNLVFIGYLFGWRRGNDARAKHLLTVGLPHLLQQVSLQPPNGYGSEGSTYAVGVEGTLSALACELLERISGEDLFNRPLKPWGNTYREALELSNRLAAPSGLLAPWDHYGYQSIWSSAPAAYLAMRTGEPDHYARVSHGNGWERSGSGAWMADDHVWQLLWMPPPAKKDRLPAPVPFHGEPWAMRHVASTLQDADHQLHLMQMWDQSAAPPTRTHMNPNNIVAEAFGSPLLIDGHADANCSLVGPLARRIGADHPMARYDAGWWAAASLGAHSCVIVNDEIEMVVPEMFPDTVLSEPTVGTLLRHETGQTFQATAADVTRFYRHRFPTLKSLRRTSSMIDNAAWVVCDEAEAEQAYRFTSQFVLRRGARQTPWGARLRTAEHVVLDVVSLGESADQFEDVGGFPSVLEKACHHFRRQVGPTKNLQLYTLLIPQLGRKLLDDWNAGWDVEVSNGDEHWHGQDVTLNEVWSRLPPHSVKAVKIELRRICELPHHDGQLVLELPQAYEASLAIDGVPVPFTRQGDHHHGEPSLLPPFVVLPKSAVPRQGGVVTVSLRLGSFRRPDVTGTVRLYQVVEPAEPRVEKLPNGDWCVWVGDRRFDVRRESTSTPAMEVPAYARSGESVDAVAGRILGTLGVKQRGGARVSDFSDGAGSNVIKAIEALDSTGAISDEPLLQILHSDRWLDRMMAARTLGERRLTTAAEALRDVLAKSAIAPASERDNVRVAIFAARSLGKIGDKAAVPLLGALAAKSVYYGLRRIAAEALGSINCPSVKVHLERFARDPDPETAAVAGRGLRRLANDAGLSQ